MEVDVMVTEHRKTETLDKERYTVVLKATTKEGQQIKLSIKDEEEDVFKKYPLRSEHAIKVSSPQTKLA